LVGDEMSIRSQQLEALERLLALTPSSQGDSWKVLVFDKSARGWWHRHRGG